MNWSFNETYCYQYTILPWHPAMPRGSFATKARATSARSLSRTMRNGLLPRDRSNKWRPDSLIRRWSRRSWRPAPSSQFVAPKAGIKTSTRKARFAIKLIAGVVAGTNDSRRSGALTQAVKGTGWCSAYAPKPGWKSAHRCALFVDQQQQLCGCLGIAESTVVLPQRYFIIFTQRCEAIGLVAGV